MPPLDREPPDACGTMTRMNSKPRDAKSSLITRSSSSETRYASVAAGAEAQAEAEDCVVVVAVVVVVVVVTDDSNLDFVADFSRIHHNEICYRIFKGRQLLTCFKDHSI